MAEQITRGAILRMLQGERVENPVLQLISIRQISPQPGTNESRFRLLISDSQYQHNYCLVSAGPGVTSLEDFPPFSIARITRFSTCQVPGSGGRGTRTVILVVEYEVLETGELVGRTIGSPVNAEEFMESNGNAAGAASTAAPVSNGNSSIARPIQMNTDAPSLADGLTYPINSLSPYQNRWVIKARVTAKGAMRTWSNAKGEGKLFSVDLKDETGEIRATAFRNEADRFYELLQVDKVYYISKCQLKPANKQYSTLKNDYEMTFSSETIIQECADQNHNIPSVQYDYVPVSQIANMETNAVVDILAVVKSVGEIQNFTSRASGRDLQKRDVNLVDNSNASITMTLWGDQAASWDPYLQPVVAIKSAQVREFGGGKTLSIISSTTIKHNPESAEATKLRRWFDSGAAESITNSVSARAGAGAGGYAPTDWLTFEEAKTLGMGDKPDYFQCKAFVHNIRSKSAVYKACPNADCNKKVLEENNQYRCEKCNSTFSTFKYRYLLTILLGDWTGNRYVTCFGDVAEQLLNKTAQEVGEADANEQEEIFSAVAFKSYVFKLRTKLEYYGDTQRNKLTVVAMNPVNYEEYNGHLIKVLQDLTGIQITE